MMLMKLLLNKEAMKEDLPRKFSREYYKSVPVKLLLLMYIVLQLNYCYFSKVVTFKMFMSFKAGNFFVISFFHDKYLLSDLILYL